MECTVRRDYDVGRHFAYHFVFVKDSMGGVRGSDQNEDGSGRV
jgi:hypothetical protein